MTQDPYRCVWAEQGLALHNSGGALLCCHSRTFLQDNNGQRIFWHTHSIDDALNSATRRDIQSALSRGEQPQNCEACFSVENAGGQSRRQAHNRLFDGHKPVPVRMLDLKLGNICNLSCRTCNPYVSSKWYSDWWAVIDQHKHEHDSYRDYLDDKYLTSKLAYNNNNTHFWQSLAALIPGVDYIDIYGAEPMMIDQLWHVLSDTVRSSEHCDKSVHFNTNCTIWDQERIDILDRFREIYIDLSIDGLDTKFEYLRNGANWQTVLANIDRYRAWAEKRWSRGRDIHINICITISLFNILDLPEITSFFDHRKISWHINHAHMPHWVNFKILPDDIKKRVSQYLEATKPGKSKHYHDMIDRDVIAYMNMPLENPNAGMQEPSHVYQQRMFQEWMRVTKELDSRRGQDFEQTFPKLYEMVKADWPQASR